MRNAIEWNHLKISTKLEKSSLMFVFLCYDRSWELLEAVLGKFLFGGQSPPCLNTMYVTRAACHMAGDRPLRRKSPKSASRSFEKHRKHTEGKVSEFEAVFSDPHWVKRTQLRGVNSRMTRWIISSDDGCLTNESRSGKLSKPIQWNMLTFSSVRKATEPVTTLKSRWKPSKDR